MTPFLLMCALYVLLRRPRAQRWPGGREPWQAAAAALGIGLVVAGVMHFVRPALFEQMVPVGLPRPDLIVFLSGVVEVGVGALLLMPGRRHLGGWCATLLFLAIWPGSIYIAISGNYPSTPTAEPLYHWLRVPFHLLYVAWALWVARGCLPWVARPVVGATAGER
jgi:uncharacterized membrane protein